MKVDFFYPPSPPEGASDSARHAAEMGYDGFFTAETQYDPFLPLALASGAEPGLEIGTAIAVAFPRSPMVMAMTAWDLARMSRGRFMLGLGTQIRPHIVRRFSTVWDSPGPRLREYILSMRAIWDAWQNATPLSFEGEYYSFSLMTPFFNPGPIPNPDVPVYIAGVGPYLSRLAGEICQGFHVHPFHTIRYLDEVVIPGITNGAEATGRGLEDVARVTTVFVMTGANDSEIEQAMEPVRQQISFYASTPSYQPVLAANQWEFGEELIAMSKRGQWVEMASLVPDEAVLEVGVAAPIDRLGDAIRERYGDRVQRVGFYTIGSALSMDPEALKEVMRQLRATPLT
jgi:probable F420-dependent oxidoreductase